MNRIDADKLISEVQAVGAARGWDMLDKLLDLIDQVEKIEREQCAAVCEAKANENADKWEGDEAKAASWMMLRCAAAIRARSNV